MRKKNKKGKKKSKDTGAGTFVISIAAVGFIIFVMLSAPFMKESVSSLPHSQTLNAFSITHEDISTLVQTLNAIEDTISETAAEETVSAYLSETEVESISIIDDIWGDGDADAWPQNDIDIWAEGDGLASGISTSPESDSGN